MNELFSFKILVHPIAAAFGVEDISWNVIKTNDIVTIVIVQ